MDTFIPLADSKDDVNIHKLCTYGHVKELKELLGIVDVVRIEATAGEGDGDEPGTPRGSDDEADVDGEDSQVSPPNSPGPGSPVPGASPRIAEDVDIDGQSLAGQTALSLCAQEGHLDCLKILLTQGADLGAPSSGGLTALMAAANKYQEACMKALIEAGADVNAQSDTGLTPVYFSIVRGVLACLKLLVSAGGDMSFKTTQGGSFIHVAAINGNVGLMKYLTEVSRSVTTHIYHYIHLSHLMHLTQLFTF